MTSSNGNISRVTGLLLEESIRHRWIPLTKASDAEFWYFRSSGIYRASNQDVGDLWRYRANYGVTVMCKPNLRMTILFMAVYKLLEMYL